MLIRCLMNYWICFVQFGFLLYLTRYSTCLSLHFDHSTASFLLIIYLLDMKALMVGLNRFIIGFLIILKNLFLRFCLLFLYINLLNCCCFFKRNYSYLFLSIYFAQWESRASKVSEFHDDHLNVIIIAKIPIYHSKDCFLLYWLSYLLKKYFF